MAASVRLLVCPFCVVVLVQGARVFRFVLIQVRAVAQAPQEIIFKDLNMSVLYLMAMDTNFQAIFNVLLTPLDAVPYIGTSTSFTNVYENLYNGCKCLFGTNSLPGMERISSLPVPIMATLLMLLRVHCLFTCFSLIEIFFVLFVLQSLSPVNLTRCRRRLRWLLVPDGSVCILQRDDKPVPFGTTALGFGLVYVSRNDDHSADRKYLLCTCISIKP